MIANISKRGVLTLPSAIRKKLGFGPKTDGYLEIQEVPGGVLLRPVTTVPARSFDPKEVQRFIEEDEQTAKDLGLWDV